MARPIEIIFEFSEGLDPQGVALPHDASVSEVSIARKISFNYAWLLNPVFAALDQNPTYTLEASHEDVSSSYKPYDPLVIDAAIDQAFDDTHLSPTWFRIVYNAQTNTAGTVKFPLILKG